MSFKRNETKSPVKRESVSWKPRQIWIRGHYQHHSNCIEGIIYLYTNLKINSTKKNTKTRPIEIEMTGNDNVCVFGTWERDNPSRKTAMMASAMVSGLQVLKGPRSRKRRFCMTPWPVAQAFCQSACNWYWYVSTSCRDMTRYKQHVRDQQKKKRKPIKEREKI